MVHTEMQAKVIKRRQQVNAPFKQSKTIAIVIIMSFVYSVINNNSSHLCVMNYAEIAYGQVMFDDTRNCDSAAL